MATGITTPSFDHITFGQPFVTSYEEASTINLGIDIAALRLFMGEHVFTLGEAKFFTSRMVDTLYLEVTTDKEVTGFLTKMRSALFSRSNISALGPQLDGGKPKLHITLFQGKGIAKNSKRLLRDIALYNQSLKEIRAQNEEQLVVFESFIPVLYAKYRSGWKMLSDNPD
jgi:hypothetical protein